jgi:hypothetical protein
MKQMLNFFFCARLSERTAAERPEEGSQGQARSEAERAAPGNKRNMDQALERATAGRSGCAVRMLPINKRLLRLPAGWFHSCSNHHHLSVALRARRPVVLDPGAARAISSLRFSSLAPNQRHSVHSS